MIAGEFVMVEISDYRCRKLCIDDLETVMHWRMLPHVTQFMKTDPVLTLEGQYEWFETLSSNGEVFQWVIHVDDKPCGVISLDDFDLLNKRCTWGYYVAEKSLRSFSLAIALEMSIYDYVFNKLMLNKIIGESFCINTAAIKMHELCGCTTEGILRQHIIKNGQLYDICIQTMLAEEWSRINVNIEYQHIDFS